MSAIGNYRAPTALSEAGTPSYSGFYSVHEAIIADGIEYVSAYSDGLRIVDLADPAEPEEIGSLLPSPALDRHGYWTALDGSRSFPLVWGVEVQDGLIFLSDVNSGLWIVRLMQTEPAADPANAL
jgi:hypothetical protein